MSLALFEDSYWQNFEPISLTKATFDIKVGAKTFFEEHHLTPEVLLTREYLASVTSERHPNCMVNPTSLGSDTLFVNGLLHPGAIYPDRLFEINHTFAITADSNRRLLVARLDSKGREYLQDCVMAGKRVNVKKLEVEKLTSLGEQRTEGIISQPWDLLRVLENSLATQVSVTKSETQLDEHVTVVGRNNSVAVGKDAIVEDGTVLDVRNGGVYIGPGAYVAASRIVGPAYIDAMTQVKQFTTIEASYIGYNCRIGGEIEHSIISDHTNKAHAGFIGHSYVGEWVNFGAMTTTSDLKMTYGNIKMDSGKNKKIDTGQNKVGSFFADMVKTSIGTLIYSGRRIGVSSHLHGLVAQDVPSFTIYGTSIGARNVELKLQSIIETQRKMMKRRNQTMTNAYEQLVENVFAMTAADRARLSVRKGKFAL
jgi:UDP-N-acetylglucosamine diphosphorylase / glucose-1-phosphate thymidylyltransferase / UDP-N-acetylgalactosamine diphosphorylase / glucosamine-1-phosphate N-acetyltransferase / galactosamine-1-phosphate N-acetyltransferase